MPDVYISCCPKDEASAQRLAKALEKQGISSGYSGGEFVRGVNTLPLMPAALRDAEFFVILISRHALKSERVRAELNWAGERKLTLLPVRLDKTPLRESFEYYLGTKQWTVADRRMTRAAKELAGQIGSIRNPDPSAAEKDPKDDPNYLYNDNNQFSIRIIALVLVIVTLLVLSTILYEDLGRTNPNLFWRIYDLMNIVMIVLLIVIMGPLFGGYKTFLRRLLSELWDAIRGK